MSSPVAQATWRDCSTGQLSPAENGGEGGGRRRKGGRGQEKKEGEKRREVKERGVDNEQR